MDDRGCETKGLVNSAVEEVGQAPLVLLLPHFPELLREAEVGSLVAFELSSEWGSKRKNPLGALGRRCANVHPRPNFQVACRRGTSFSSPRPERLEKEEREKTGQHA